MSKNESKYVSKCCRAEISCDVVSAYGVPIETPNEYCTYCFNECESELEAVEDKTFSIPHPHKAKFSANANEISSRLAESPSEQGWVDRLDDYIVNKLPEITIGEAEDLENFFKAELDRIAGRVEKYLKFEKKHRAESYILETIEFCMKLATMSDTEFNELQEWWNRGD